MCIKARRMRQSGVTLIELIIFIVIVSVAVVGILSVMNITTRASADPMIRKQALAIAESLLEEIQLQPFTYCFPADEQASTAAGVGDCTVSLGNEDTLPSVSRVSNIGARDADNVADYNNFSMSPIRGVTGDVNGTLAGYSASVAIAQAGSALGLANNNDALQIDVTVSGRGESITLTGYRLRYAPRAVP